MSEPIEQIATILLKSTASVVERHERINKAQAKGFNVFDVVGRATDEVYGHSAMIGELLDPNGSHGQGDHFLTLFFDMLRKQAKIPDALNSLLIESRPWTAEREKGFTLTIGNYAGWSGRIDIAVECSDAILIIENKIYAGDQDAQMERYRQYGETIHPGKTFLFYLTRSGSAPSAESVADMLDADQKRIVLLSYDDISNWIEDCIASTALLPHLRETLSQYNRLVTRISKGFEEKEMTMEIANNIENPDTFRAALGIQSAITEVKARVQLKVWQELEARLLSLLPIKPEELIRTYSHDQVNRYYMSSRNNREYGIAFPITTQDNGWKLMLAIEVDSRIYYGFYLRKGTEYSKNSQDCDPRIVELVKMLNIENDHNSGPFVPGRWWYASPELNFEEFDKDCIELLNPMTFSQTIEKIAGQINRAVAEFRRLAKERGYNFSS